MSPHIKCPWRAPGGWTKCGGQADVAVEYRGGIVVPYCLHHAHLVVGQGKAHWICTVSHPCKACNFKIARVGWPTPMGDVPITWCDFFRVAADGA